MASPGNQYCANCIGTLSFRIWGDKKLSYRRGTARCVVSVAILPIAKQQCKKTTCTTSPEQIEVMKLEGLDVRCPSKATSTTQQGR